MYSFTTAATSKAIASGTCKQYMQALIALCKEYRTFSSKFNPTRSTCTLSRERFEDGSFEIHYSINPKAIPPTHGRFLNIQHDVTGLEQFHVGKRILRPRFWFVFPFFCLLSLQRKEANLSNSK